MDQTGVMIIPDDALELVNGGVDTGGVALFIGGAGAIGGGMGMSGIMTGGGSVGVAATAGW